MTENDAPTTVEARSAAYGGFTLGTRDGKALLIRGAIPGETVAVRITHEKRDYALAATDRVLTPSPERVVPRCGLFGRCGGCQLQHLSHRGQVRIKEEILRDCLARIGKIETDLSPSLISESPWHYRYRGQFKTRGTSVGFFKEQSKDLVRVTSCPLMAEGINDRLQNTEALLHILSRSPKSRSIDGEAHITLGEGAHALIRYPVKTHTAIISRDLAAALRKSGFAGVTMALGDKIIAAHGTAHCTLPLDGLTYCVSPLSFLQANWRLNQDLVRLVRASLKPLGGTRVVDLYAGSGNFALPLAQDAEEVIAVEENPHAIRDGIRNARRNNLDNCTFVSSSVEGFRWSKPVHVLLMDPPRSGLTNKAVEQILQVAPRTVVYLSCNPATLSRDLRKLATRYTVESVRMVDFFPQTYHIEALVFLSLR